MLDEKALAKGGYGGILGVGLRFDAGRRDWSGSPTSRAKPVATVALVGKGITFDSGGSRSSRPRTWTT